MSNPDELTVLPVANPTAEIPFKQPPDQISITLRVANLIAVILPLVGLVAAIVAVWGWGFHWADLGLLIGMYFLTAIGITVGYHRLFTHKSFETNRIVQCIFGILGSMAVQGPVLEWVAMHRRHHQHSDEPDACEACYWASGTHIWAGSFNLVPATYRDT
jgi:stearoyl-CoA desaturase (delta-9 desaturase)